MAENNHDENAQTMGKGNKEEVPPPFEVVKENNYICDPPAVEKSMKCSCTFDPEVDDISEACGHGCVNRAILEECNPRKCPCNEYCQNQRFQKSEFQEHEVFKTLKKGWGVRAVTDIPEDAFLIEYCGDVMNKSQFLGRVREYDNEGRTHYYFMNLHKDLIIDATRRGNNSRYLNHSCDPNCVTQKWHVNGEIRIGLFAKKDIKCGEELTFDYKYERYGQKAQECYCESANCRGTLGQSRNTNQLSDNQKLASIKKKMKSGNLKMEEILELPFEQQMEYLTENDRLVDKKKVLPFVQMWLEFVDMESEYRFLLLPVVLATTDEGCLKEFLRYRGLGLIRVLYTDEKSGEAVKDEVLKCLGSLPVTHQNTVEDSGFFQVLEDALERDGTLEGKVQPILEKWKSLPKKYVIPKRARRKSNNPESKEVSTTATSANSTPNLAKQASSMNTPNESGSSQPKSSPYSSGIKRSYNDYNKHGNDRDRLSNKKRSFSENHRDRDQGGFRDRDRGNYERGPRRGSFSGGSDRGGLKWRDDKDHGQRGNEKDNSNAPLPPNWEAYVDETSGETYYFDKDTNTTTWERPSAKKILSVADRPIRSGLQGLSNPVAVAEAAKETSFVNLKKLEDRRDKRGDSNAHKDSSKHRDRKLSSSRDETEKKSSHHHSKHDSSKSKNKSSHEHSKSDQKKSKKRSSKEEKKDPEAEKDKLKEFQKKAHSLLYKYLGEKYMEEDCTVARITCKEDQKYLSHTFSKELTKKEHKSNSKSSKFHIDEKHKEKMKEYCDHQMRKLSEKHGQTYVRKSSHVSPTS
eukprot:Nk52_evm50s230 gene=Nk52_evmTU50s230